MNQGTRIPGGNSVDDEKFPRPAGGRNQYLTIQALRFFAAITVVILHCSFYVSERLDPSFPVYAFGGSGVRLFFVISGFVMILSSEKLHGDPRGAAIFLLRRVIRIVPIYWLVIAFKVVMLAVTPSAAKHSVLDWTAVAKSLFFIPYNNPDGEILPIVGVGWTLDFEMFFYILFALALWLRARPILMLAPVLIGISIAGQWRTNAWPVPLYFWCNPIVLDFLAGMLIARWAQTHRALPPLLDWILVTGGLCYLFVPFPHPAYDSLVGSLLSTLASAAVIIGAISLEPRVSRQIPRWVLYLGAASYSIFLIHPSTAPAASAILVKFGLKFSVLGMVGGIAVALVAGTLLYRFVERPLTRAIENWARARGWLTSGVPGGSKEPASNLGNTVTTPTDAPSA